MVKNCCVPRCFSGLASEETPSDSKITFHAFPKEDELRKKWINSVHRKKDENSKEL